MLTCVLCSYLPLFSNFLFLASEIQFTSRYSGKTVTGLVGSTVNFKWSFSGDVRRVVWGITSDGSHYLEYELVSLHTAGSVALVLPSEYAGRVNGSRSGDSSSGHAIFTLSNIRKEDEKFYACLIRPTIPDETSHYDYVRLFVEGRFIV